MKTSTLLDELERCVPAAPPRVREIARVLRYRLAHEVFNEDEGSEADRQYRRAWNASARSLLRGVP